MITPSQTVGPFFGYALPYDGGPRVAPEWHPAAIRLHGVVYDGTGRPVPDAILEIWQPGPDGAVPASAGTLRRGGGSGGFAGFTGFGRCPTDRDGAYWFCTVRPGPRAGAPHIAMLVFARGLLKPVATRVYFPEEAEANATDPVLAAVDDDRRETLIAGPDGDRAYRFDVYLQGERETVFFAF